MEIRRIRTLALETFKSLNKLNPHFMKDLFNKRNTFERKKNNLEIPRRNTVKFGDNSVKSLGPHIWNSLPEEIKSEQSYEKFKGFIETNYGMDQIANAVFVFPYKKLNIHIKYILDSDKLIRKNIFVVLKIVALGIDPFK